MSDPRAFQVDLRGVVDLLARHLYSGPRVYLRELLQNAVDAITARDALGLPGEARVRLRPLADGALAVTDTGIGLTAAEAAELLATVGRSSKRGDLGLAREEFLGQFGIGLLSAFMVADAIEMVSRSAAHPDAPAVLWRGHADGSYELTELPDLDVPTGSTVWLRPRRDCEHWLEPATVTELAKEFGELLPVDLAVEVPLGAADPGEPCAGAVDAARLGAGGAPRPGHAWRRLTEPELPWRRAYPDAAARSAALSAHAERALGLRPLAAIDLDVPLAGVSGVAYVLPAAVPPGGGGAHRVYVKRMLLGTRVTDLLPEWAFFVRCVVDATALRPTASREQLYSDDVLLATQDALAATVRAWVLRTLEAGGPLAASFVATHHLAVRSLALVDDQMLDLAVDALPFETTDGPATLLEVEREHGVVVYAPSLEQYRRIAPVARAQGLVVVNGGYVYDADLLARLAQRHPARFRELAAADVAQVLGEASPERELATLDAVERARVVLAPLDCEPVLRTFAPEHLPAVLLTDRDAEHQRDLRRTVDEADDLWSDVLSGFARPKASRRLVLNDACPLVRELLAAPPGEVARAGVRALYVQAVMLAGEPLRARDAGLMTDAMTALLRHGLGLPGGGEVADGGAREPRVEPGALTDPEDEEPR